MGASNWYGKGGKDEKLSIDLPTFLAAFLPPQDPTTPFSLSVTVTWLPGKDVVFNETFSFNKQIHEAALQVAVFDKDTLSDDFLGQGSLDLHDLNLEADAERLDPVQVVTNLKGKPAGKVYLKFSRISTV